MFSLVSFQINFAKNRTYLVSARLCKPRYHYHVGPILANNSSRSNSMSDLGLRWLYVGSQYVAVAWNGNGVPMLVVRRQLLRGGSLECQRCVTVGCMGNNCMTVAWNVNVVSLLVVWGTIA